MGNFSDLVNIIIEIIMLAIPVVFGLALLVITWGVVNAWIINGGDETKIKEGKQIIVAGVIGLVVMSGIWGILAILQSSLSLG